MKCWALILVSTTLLTVCLFD
uniref:Uncharacterized protein n=1 Tax=Tetranychus urticae TaxID=32264 RepID=T1JW02_TETUR